MESDIITGRYELHRILVTSKNIMKCYSVLCNLRTHSFAVACLTFFDQTVIDERTIDLNYMELDSIFGRDLEIEFTWLSSIEEAIELHDKEFGN